MSDLKYQNDDLYMVLTANLIQGLILVRNISALRNWKNIFSTPRLNNWNGKFPIGSLYEFTSRQKFFVLVSQASYLIIGQINYSFPWDKISYGRDFGHGYSLSSRACMNSGNWNRFVLVRILILSVVL